MAAAAPALAEVLQRADIWRGSMPTGEANAGRASGFAELDRHLPGGGWPCGTLTELLCRDAGIGELSLLLPALAALEETGWIALVAPPWKPHAPAWQRAGVPLSRLLVVEASGADAAWACEQLLGSETLGAVIAWLPQADAAILRRLQLAAQGRRSLVFIFRPEGAAAGASPAPLRMALAAGDGALSLRILKRRGPLLADPLPLPVTRPLAWQRVASRLSAGVVRAPSSPQPVLP